MSEQTLDELWPPCGPCAFCGGPDKRHRIWDAIASRHACGETVEELAEDYSITPAHIRAAIEHGVVDTGDDAEPLNGDEPTVWEVTRDGLSEPGAIAGYSSSDRHLALIQWIGEDEDGWDHDAYDHAVEIRRHHPEPEAAPQIFKVLIFRSQIEERRKR